LGRHRRNVDAPYKRACLACRKIQRDAWREANPDWRTRTSKRLRR
jgi:hypothetical protein